MNLLKNFKFVQKIQLGFFLLAIISTVIIITNYWKLSELASIKEQIFNDYVAPQEQVYNVYADFQVIQTTLLKMTHAELASNFNENLNEYQSLKGKIDTALDSLLASDLKADIKSSLKEIKTSWIKYKTEAADATLSAVMIQDYVMAADIALSTGEEFGKELVGKFVVVKNGLSRKAETLNKAVDSTFSAAITYTIAGAATGTVIFIICTFILAPAITKPINYLKGVVKEFSLGNYDVAIENNSKDEIGELTGLFSVLQNAQQEKISAAQKIADGIAEKVTPASDKDLLAFAFNKEIDTIDSLLHEFKMLVEANRSGNLDVRGNVAKFSGGWKEIIEGANSVMEAFIKPINEAAIVLETMANGDLTTQMHGDYKGTYLLIKKNINQLNSSLSSALYEVSETVASTASAANEISASTEEMAAGAHEQTQQTTDVAAAIEQMTKTILENTSNASLAAETSKEAGSKAKAGGEVVDSTIAGMIRIADVVKHSADTVQALGKSSDAIGEIIEVIDDIADQTNLLALNAAIEAARAGEQGRGFAVVADEVRKLAERTSKATKEIAGMIKQIQKDTNAAVKSMNEGNIEADNGKQLAVSAGEVLKDIIDSAGRVSDIAVSVAAASEQQSSAAEQIAQNIEAISNVASQNADGTRQIAKSAEELSNLTLSLDSLIKKFRINNVSVKKEYEGHNGSSNGKSHFYN